MKSALFKFVRAYRAGALFGRETTETVAAGKIPEDERNQSRWGYGIKERIINGEIVRGHSGGGRTDVQMLWNAGYSVIVQTNQTPPPVTALSNEIVGFLAAQTRLRKADTNNSVGRASGIKRNRLIKLFH
jgi:hypothetical protein